VKSVPARDLKKIKIKLPKKTGGVAGQTFPLPEGIGEAAANKKQD